MVTLSSSVASIDREREKVSLYLAEKSFRHFARQAWPIVEPGRDLQSAFYIDAICDHLQAVAEGDIKRLVVTLPPGFLKSTLVSVLFPAWLWIRDPSRRFLTTSHDSDLAMRDAVRSRRVIMSDWYQQRWGDLFAMTTDQNVKTRYENDKTGHRISLGVDSGVTGKRGDMILCDDPHDAEDIHRATALAETIRWWNETMPSRLNDPKTGAKIVIQQRLHVNDLAGEVIGQGYEHLNLPMEYDPAQASPPTAIGWTDPRSLPGELLHPERYGPEEVAQARRELGTQAYEAQYQQQPVPTEGGMFKRHWWQRYRVLPDIKAAIVTVDSAFKDGVENDFSVFALWCSDGQGNAYLPRRWKARVAFPELIRLGHEAHAYASLLLPHIKIPLLVEDKASGQSAIQVWNRPYQVKGDTLPALPVVPFTIKGRQSKVARAEGVTALVEGGRAFLPMDADWVDDFITEHEQFPTGKHDDQVDTTSMALTRLDLKRQARKARIG